MSYQLLSWLAVIFCGAILFFFFPGLQTLVLLTVFFLWLMLGYFFPAIFASLHSLTKLIQYYKVDNAKAKRWGIIFAFNTALGLLFFACLFYLPLINRINAINQAIITHINALIYPSLGLSTNSNIVVMVILALLYLWIFSYGLMVTINQFKHPGQDYKTKFSSHFWFIFLVFISIGLLDTISEPPTWLGPREIWIGISSYQTLNAAITAFFYALIVSNIVSLSYTLWVGSIAIVPSLLLLKLYPGSPFTANLIFIGANLIVTSAMLFFNKNQGAKP